jgi:phosphoribosylaminoimidazolecarboxamide formyltransferase/IMP cyclohydrolase
MKKIQRAIISVTDKSGVVEFARELTSMGIEIISTGGTGKLLEEEGIAVVPISTYTGFPEMLGGRVKTLHPKIHGGILAIRDNNEHLAQMAANNIEPIDMVVVNLYEFEKTVASDCTIEDAIENIDIGGPTMIRSAAKNYRDVVCVTDPADYNCIIEKLKDNDASLCMATRFKLAKKVFEMTARYDSAISNYLGGFDEKMEEAEGFSDKYGKRYEKVQDLRYGENPHQKAAFYKEPNAADSTLASAKQHQGKELSFNNILDINAALLISRDFTGPTCVIIKHNNPCGVATSKDGLLAAYDLALACDSKSAFGGIVGFNGTVTNEIAAKLTGIFLEAVIAPSFEPAALETFKKKKNLRVLEVATEDSALGQTKGFDIKKVSGGVLIQELDTHVVKDTEVKVATKRQPTEAELADLLFAWKVCKHVKSNAIIFAKDGQAVGIGAGQMSRIDSTRIATLKAADAELEIKGAVLASDAFFPFSDNVEMAAKNGITAIIQPGGSIRDEEVIKAADDAGIAMVFTGIRHFRH